MDIWSYDESTRMVEPFMPDEVIEYDAWLMMMDVEREYFVNDELEYYPDDWSPSNVLNGRSKNSLVSAEIGRFLIDALFDQPPSADAQPFSPLQRSKYKKKDFDLNCNRIRKFASTADSQQKAVKFYKSMRKPCTIPRCLIKWKDGMPKAHPVKQHEYRALPRILTCSSSMDYSWTHLYPHHPDSVSEFNVDFLVVKLLADVENTIITPDGKLVATNVLYETTTLFPELLTANDNMKRKLAAASNNAAPTALLDNLPTKAASSKRRSKAKKAGGKPPRKKCSKKARFRTVNVTVKSLALTTGSIRILHVPVATKRAPKIRRNTKKKPIVGTASINVKESHRNVQANGNMSDAALYPIPTTIPASKVLVEVNHQPSRHARCRWK
jgi:hypothetical protein